jgi:hypothetical protein
MREEKKPVSSPRHFANSFIRHIKLRETPTVTTIISWRVPCNSRVPSSFPHENPHAPKFLSRYPPARCLLRLLGPSVAVRRRQHLHLALSLPVPVSHRRQAVYPTAPCPYPHRGTCTVLGHSCPCPPPPVRPCP